VKIEQSKGGYNPSPSRQYYDSSPDCYKRPHYILGVLCIIGDILFLGLASACWGKIKRSSDKTVVSFLWFGSGALVVCLWLVYHGLGLIEFRVFPCAVLSSPSLAISISTHLSHA
jgi:hypothetical protein